MKTGYDLLGLNIWRNLKKWRVAVISSRKKWGQKKWGQVLKYQFIYDNRVV